MTHRLSDDELTPGPLIIDVEGTVLTSQDCELIGHPLTGGVILFSRNYRNPQQLKELVRAMRQARNGPLLVSVDQEGGRVQRFKDGFTRIPSMKTFGALYDTDQRAAQQALENTTWLLASELHHCGVDYTFAPVVDIDHATSEVIGDRAFHHTVDGVEALANAAISGLARAGFASVIKHFPGHGSVSTDTHEGMASDHRSYKEIECTDLEPFRRLSRCANAVMPAHVVYDQVDDKPASLSHRWQTGILRQTLCFDGAIISDDLSMGAITSAMHQSKAAAMALQAGSDLVLVCNDREAVQKTMDDGTLPTGDTASVHRRLGLRAKPVASPSSCELDAVRQGLRQCM